MQEPISSAYNNHLIQLKNRYNTDDEFRKKKQEKMRSNYNERFKNDAVFREKELERKRIGNRISRNNKKLQQSS